MSKDDGGPAFPVLCDFDANVVTGHRTANSSGWEIGVSIRDYFAAHANISHIAVVSRAIKEHLKNEGDMTKSRSDADIEATLRYEFADSMLAERQKGSS